MTRLMDLKKRLMEDPEFRKEYARVDEEFELIEALVRARTAAKLTQAELARRPGTTQPAVARPEGQSIAVLCHLVSLARPAARRATNDLLESVHIHPRGSLTRLFTHP